MKFLRFFVTSARCIAIALTFLTHPLCSVCQEAEDGLDVDVTMTTSDSVIALNTVRVTAHNTTSTIRSVGGSVMWGTDLLQQMPRIAGNADPIHYSQMLPGVQVNSEYRGGINVQGCDNAHTMVSIGGVPIYNSNHLLGIFSTFNSSHFPAMTLDKSVNSARHPLRLGAWLDMQLPHAPSGSSDTTACFSGELECGLISSQGTLRINCSEDTRLVISGRGSYMNLLYSKLLAIEGSAFRYAFGDANLTLLHRRGNHLITLDGYYGMDAAKVNTAKVNANFHSRWGNNMQALHWDFQGAIQASTVFSHSAFRNMFNLQLSGENLSLPSSIDDITLKSDLAWRLWNFGAHATYFNIEEQYPTISDSYIIGGDSPPRRHSGLFSIYADYTFPFSTDNWRINMGLRPTVYLSYDHTSFMTADPQVCLKWKLGTYDASLSCALRHQYLFFVGVTDMGLPNDFWLPASTALPPQWSGGVNLSAGTWFFHRQWRLEIEAFYKRMLQQEEYAGTALDYFDSDFSALSYLKRGDGKNWGASVMLSHPFGRFTGWIAYSYTRAQRTSEFIETRQGRFPASHERPHELNVLCSFSINKHWQVSSTAVLASGTPFTAPRYFYILAGTIISEYGEHNANRLPPYFRIDVSGSYKWNLNHRVQQSVNLSIYNATARKNALHYSLNIDRSGNRFRYKPSSFIATVLPSVSYILNF